MEPIRQVRRTDEEEETNTTVMGDEIRAKLGNNIKLTELKVDIVELTRKCCFGLGVLRFCGCLTQLRVVKKMFPPKNKKNKPFFNRIIQCLDDLRAPMTEKKEVKKNNKNLETNTKLYFYGVFFRA